MSKEKIEVVSLEYYVKRSQSSKINMDPSHQRNNIWGPSLETSFVNTLIRGGPIGVLSFAKIGNVLHSLDGKQRTFTMVRLLNNKIRYNSMYLSKTERDHGYPDLNERKFDEFSEEIKNKIRLTSIILWSKVMTMEEASLEFRIMNELGKHVNLEEKRNALHPHGIVNSMKKRLATHSYWKTVYPETLLKRKIAEEFINHMLYLIVENKPMNNSSGLGAFIERHESSNSQTLKDAEATLKQYIDIISEVIPAREGMSTLYSKAAQYSLFHLFHNMYKDRYVVKNMKDMKNRLAEIQLMLNAKEQQCSEIIQYKDTMKDKIGTELSRQRRVASLEQLTRRQFKQV